MLHGRKILIGVSGSIAAYKICFLVRLLVKEGAEIQILLTPSAKDFVTPLTLATLSKKPVYTTFVKDGDTGTWANHVELAMWADVFLIAPATANILAKMAHGICNNLVLATYFSAKCPVYVAPAMDLDMYKHPTTAENLQKLKSWGVRVIDAKFGELASGLTGEGRMAEPEEILSFLERELNTDKSLSGKKVLISAGPTWEPIDPVRFIGNHSSGKMGIALANVAYMKGADVHLVCGPVQSAGILSGITQTRVTSANEMYEVCVEKFKNTDIGIMAAAVADFTPKSFENQKIKKKDAKLSIELIPTQDILKKLGTLKQTNQILVGFALETENETENAFKKLISKNLDFIVLNSLNDDGAGFGTETNKVSFLSKDNKIENFTLKTKVEVAKDIIQKIVNLLS